MPSDMPAGADTPPIDELSSAEASLTELQKVVHPIGADDLGKQTACREYDVASLTDHLMKSITTIGNASGADMPARDSSDSVERQIIMAARPCMDAWRRRGIEGAVKVGAGEVPAKVLVGILSLEFLVHAWDYAQATGQAMEPTPELSEYVLELARRTITPDGRSNVGFDMPVDVPDDAPAFDRLLAFTGRRPGYARSG
jgi:uncharacterized protein (TIGR03086 family)